MKTLERIEKLEQQIKDQKNLLHHLAGLRYGNFENAIMCHKEILRTYERERATLESAAI